MVWLGTPQMHGANPSPALKPAEPKNTEQPAHDSPGLRDDRAVYLDIIDYVLEIVPA
jgi:hypothetical protein